MPRIRTALATLLIAAMVAAGMPAPAPSFVSQAEAAVQKKPAPARKKTIKSAVKRKALSAPKRVSSMAESPRYAAAVVDASSGQVLYQVDGGGLRHPASLTKMMTLYLLFDAMKKGRVSLDTMFPVSTKAASAAPTNINLTAGDRITVKTAIESLVVRSANDSAMVVAEGIGGSQEGFAQMMNRKARQLGMTSTQFYNPSGLPDARQVTTAYDMARLGIALKRDFPEYYHYFSIREFTYRGQNYTGHNRLLGRYPGADGIKTGYTNASGFNLVTSARRGGTRLVAVVLGGTTAGARDQRMMDLLDRTFAAKAGGGGSQTGRKAEEEPVGQGDRS